MPEAKQKIRRRRAPQEPRRSAETKGGTGNEPETVTPWFVAAAEEAAQRLCDFSSARILAERNCLLVIDDVWDASHLRPFLRGRDVGGAVFRTVNIEASAQRVLVDEMNTSEAIELLTRSRRPGYGATQKLAR